jgi:hypothetical protein
MEKKSQLFYKKMKVIPKFTGSIDGLVIKRPKKNKKRQKTLE